MPPIKNKVIPNKVTYILHTTPATPAPPGQEQPANAVMAS